MTSMVGRTVARDAESIDARTEISFGGSTKGSVGGLRFANSTARAKGPARRVHIQKRGFFYDAAFAHTMMRGLVAAPLGRGRAVEAYNSDRVLSSTWRASRTFRA
jgi:hypothetical protein